MQVQISEKTIGYIRAVHGAAEDRERLRKEVRHSSNTLFFLNDGCEDSEQGQTWAEFIKPLDGSLARLKQALEFAAARLQTRSSLKVKLRWPFDKEEVQGLIDVIKSEEVLLGLALEVSSARLLHEINVRTKECESNLVELEVLMVVLQSWSAAKLRINRNVLPSITSFFPPGRNSFVKLGKIFDHDMTAFSINSTQC
jgi:hypothetical protein